MKKLLLKEIKLSASPLSFIFISAGLLTFCPGYPILVGTFLVCLGLFMSFQNAREANDIVYTALLPISKRNVVKARYIFCIFIELLSFVINLAATLLRMTVLSDSIVYRSNALMNANPAYLGFVLLIFALFNSIFICGYFKTAYKFAKPFITFAVVAFLAVAIGEALHYFPSMEAINAFGCEHLGLQLGIFCTGAVLYIILTLMSTKRAMKHFESIDL